MQTDSNERKTMTWPEFLVSMSLRFGGIIGASMIVAFPASLIIGVIMLAASLFLVIPDIFSDSPIGGGLHNWALADSYWEIYWFSVALSMAISSMVALHPETYSSDKITISDEMKQTTKMLMALTIIVSVVFALMSFNLVAALIIGPIVVLAAFCFR